MMESQSEITTMQEACLLPCFRAKIPVSLSLNGKQTPPLEADGEMIRFSSSRLRIRTDSKIPIPSCGVIRFSLDAANEDFALIVDFVQRVEIANNRWFWKMTPKYEMQAVLRDNEDGVKSKYAHFVNRLFFNGQSKGFEPYSFSKSEFA
ncbi:MAG: hypothetical protein JXR73_06925 [Candidatus Omnitrophica bacterium]|nr:hypothetical protein [Candidatus Omnitrophota bacterium]